MNETKPFIISKNLVMKAYQCVKENRGSAGIDRQSLEDFDKNLQDNLYRLWNRLSSGSYFPPPVMGVAIPKKSGGERILGIPTVSDTGRQRIWKLSYVKAFNFTNLPMKTRGQPPIENNGIFSNKQDLAHGQFLQTFVSEKKMINPTGYVKSSS